MSLVLLVLLTILILSLWHHGYLTAMAESFRSCKYCPDAEEARLDKNAMLNPFIWPYSGGGDPDMNNLVLEHPNVPDHELLVGYGE